jgi:hypothetical protein
MFDLLRGLLSFWKIIFILVLFFCVLWPMVAGTYSAVQAFYWWMRP